MRALMSILKIIWYAYKNNLKKLSILANIILIIAAAFVFVNAEYTILSLLVWSVILFSIVITYLGESILRHEDNKVIFVTTSVMVLITILGLLFYNPKLSIGYLVLILGVFVICLVIFVDRKLDV